MPHSELFVNPFINSSVFMPLFLRMANIKQVPMLFALMSGKREADYRSIYTWIQENLDGLKVKTITSDFELALWNAATKVFGDDIQIRGCLFH